MPSKICKYDISCHKLVESSALHFAMDIRYKEMYYVADIIDFVN